MKYKIKNRKIILGIIAFLAVYLLLGAYFNFTKPKNIEIQKEESINQIQTTLNVLDKTYDISIEAGTSVYQAMQKLQNNNSENFSFHGQEYQSLGFFVDKINGIKNSPDKYWIYYINNQKASVGVSKYILKSGDIITWKQEANF